MVGSGKPQSDEKPQSGGKPQYSKESWGSKEPQNSKEPQGSKANAGGKVNAGDKVTPATPITPNPLSRIKALLTFNNIIGLIIIVVLLALFVRGCSVYNGWKTAEDAKEKAAEKAASDRQFQEEADAYRKKWGLDEGSGDGSSDDSSDGSDKNESEKKDERRGTMSERFDAVADNAENVEIADESALLGQAIDTSYTGTSFAVKVDAAHQQLWGLMSDKGTWTVPPIFTVMPEDSAEQLYRMEGPSSMGSQWGFVDRTGTWKIKAKFKEAGEFHEGLAAVHDKATDKWGVIDTEGHWVISPQFDSIGNFSDGLAPVAVYKGGRTPACGYIDKNGRMAIPLNASWTAAAPFSEGLAAVRMAEPNEVRYINMQGQEVLDGNPDGQGWVNATSFHNGRAFVWAWNGDKYIDTAGNTVLDTDSSSGFAVGDGYALVDWRTDAAGNRGFGYVDGSGNLLGDMVFKDADVFRGGYGVVELANPSEGASHEYALLSSDGTLRMNLRVGSQMAKATIQKVADAGPESRLADGESFTCATAGGKSIW